MSVSRKLNERSTGAKRHSANRLSSAHKGYEYQDVATAYLLAEALAVQQGEFEIDKKISTRDRFDDLTIQTNKKVVRRQFKYSKSANRCLQESDFTTEKSDLKVTDLVNSYLVARELGSIDCRLCATWRAPIDSLSGVVNPVTAPATFPPRINDPHFQDPKHFRLNGKRIWPEGSDPIWDCLQKSDIQRTEFLEFCDHFLIELECPRFSGDFRSPGPIEGRILDVLGDSVGVGRYPNQWMDVCQVSDSLVRQVTVARGSTERIRISDVERWLGLNRDYGRIAQQFPVEGSLFVTRNEFELAVKEASLNNTRLILKGPPGAGKSWSIDHLSSSLQEDGHLVARHFCYLEPGDEHVAARININTMWGNLIADLVEAVPKLRLKGRTRYSAGKEELESILPEAVLASKSGKVILVVDGADHIRRVLNDQGSIRPNETNLIEELALLSIPDGVHVIVGSQPGDHLKPLTDLNCAEISVPEWGEPEFSSLVDRLGIASLLKPSGAEIASFVQKLAVRSEGNPLYGTYLCRELLAQFHAGQLDDPISFIERSPALDGDLANYYEHLLPRDDRASLQVANLLACADFGLLRSELEEILAPVAYDLESSLKRLEPVFKDITAQGGYRIYHESFRRFILERLEASGTAIGKVIEPLRAFLESHGFYQDAKAFRFLFPLMRRAGDGEGILELVGTTFVSDSVCAGYSERAILSNLEIACDVAAECINWPALARCAHLLASARICFSEKFDAYLFGTTFATIFGPQTLSERLSFDGRPTFPREVGLMLCDVCDRAGGTSPWQQYLELSPSSDENSFGDSKIAIALCEFRGRLRKEGTDSMIPRIVRFFNKVSKDVDSDYVRGIVRNLSEIGGIAVVERVTKRIKRSGPILDLLEAELAVLLDESGDRNAALVLGAKVLNRQPSIEIAANLYLLGARPGPSGNIAYEVSTIDPTLRSSASNEKGEIEEWIASIEIQAVVSPSPLIELREKVSGEGWYRQWLQYAIDLSLAKAVASSGGDASTQIVKALKDVAVNPEPFSGEPRACDLFRLRDVIKDSFSEGLRLLKTSDQCRESLGNLAEISRGTTTYLQGTRCGPLTADVLVELALSLPSTSEFNQSALELIRRELDLAEEHGEFYEIHAEHEMQLAYALAVLGEVEQAKVHWKHASIFMTAYGMHKDVLLFELAESLPALVRLDPEGSKERAVALQRLCDIAIDHTDGKETTHLPNAWFAALLSADLIGGILLLFRSLTKSGGRDHWVLERAVQDVLEHTTQVGDPQIRLRLIATIPYNNTKSHLRLRLDAIRELFDSDTAAASDEVLRLAAQIQGDPDQFDPAAYQALAELALMFGVVLQTVEAVVGTTVQADPSTVPDAQQDSVATELTAGFPIDFTPVNLLSWVREHRSQIGVNEESDSAFRQELHAWVMARLGAGEEEIVTRTLRQIARELRYSKVTAIYRELASELENASMPNAAAVALTIAFCQSPGNSGWGFLGDVKDLPLITKATQLSRDLSLSVLASEIAEYMRRGYWYGMGQHLVEACAECSTRDVAIAVWDNIYGVLNHRLPQTESGPVCGDFDSYLPAAHEELTVDEALVILLSARLSHPELQRKRAAISGLCETVKEAPHSVIPAIESVLAVNSPVSTVQLVLQILEASEQEPFPITRAIRSQLQDYANADHFAIRQLAIALLDRIDAIIPAFHARAIVPNVALSEELTEQRICAILSLDCCDRIEQIEQIIPNFGELVATEFHRIWTKATEFNERRTKSRIQAAGSPSRKGPLVPMLFWQNELFEIAINRVACIASDELRETEFWDEKADSALLCRLIPDLVLLNALFISRGLRPPIPLPAEIIPGSIEISTVSDGSKWTDWYRAGLFEEQLVFDDNRWEISGEVTHINGIETAAPDMGTSDRPLPLGQGSARMWQTAPTVELSPPKFRGPLIGLEILNDFLGIRPVLILHPRLAAICQLRADPNGRLQLVDKDGEVAVVCRTWRVRSVGSYSDSELPILQGCEILVRPDILDRIASYAVAPLQSNPIVIGKRKSGS